MRLHHFCGLAVMTGLVGCVDGGDASLPGHPPSPTWSVLAETDQGALLSVWGRGPDDVWIAGGQVDQGLILRGHGTEFEPVEVDAPHLLWWVYGIGERDVYAVGNHGLILHYDGSTWERADADTDCNLYGVWGASPDDVWIVGGDPHGDKGAARVLRGSGRSFHEVPFPAELAPRALFKVYGDGDRDVLAVGSDGTVVRWDGNGWKADETPTHASLFSVWGRSYNDLYAVGGFADGELLHFDGASWTRAKTDGPLRSLSGVFTQTNEPVIAVGDQAYVLELDDDGTTRAPEVPGLRRSMSLHSVWGDGQGRTYAVGGELMAFPLPMDGVVIVRE